MNFSCDCLPSARAGRSAQWHSQCHFAEVFRWFTFAALLAALLVTPMKSASADSWHYGVVWGADWVDLSHPGVHTHQNKIAFNIRRLYMHNPSYIYVVPHCQYWTWTWGYGSIEHWTLQFSGSYAVVLAPSRFVDALYAEATRDVYYQTWPYYAEVWWYGP